MKIFSISKPEATTVDQLIRNLQAIKDIYGDLPVKIHLTGTAEVAITEISIDDDYGRGEGGVLIYGASYPDSKSRF